MKFVLRAAIAISCLLVFHQAASAATEMDDLLAAFANADVKSLKHEPLHADAKNKDLVKLGQLLFFDRILSGSNNISCAACHFPTKGTSDSLPLPIGAGGFGLALDRQIGSGHLIPRNAPTAFNLGDKNFHSTMWDGRISVRVNSVSGVTELSTPEPAINGPQPHEADVCAQITTVAAAQALFPVTSADEMRGSPGENDIADAKSNVEAWQRLTARLVGKKNGSVGGIPKYRALMKLAYPEIRSFDEINFGHVARAIGAFEIWAFRANESAFDDFLEGDRTALSRRQFLGAQTFAGKGQCLECHSGSHLTDFKFYSSGMPQLGPGKSPIAGQTIGEDFGREGQTKDPADRYKFKVPSLRNVSHSGPWSHSGSYNDLKGFLRHHLDAKTGMRNYLANPAKWLPSPSKTAVDFTSVVDLDSARNAARVQSVDPIFRSIQLNEKEIDDVFEFLKSLSDLSVYSRPVIPASVPSGLPVEI